MGTFILLSRIVLLTLVIHLLSGNWIPSKVRDEKKVLITGITERSNMEREKE